MITRIHISTFNIQTQDLFYFQYILTSETDNLCMSEAVQNSNAFLFTKTIVAIHSKDLCFVPFYHIYSPLSFR